MSGIRCVRLGRHTKDAGQGVLQDRFGKHWPKSLRLAGTTTRTRGLSFPARAHRSVSALFSERLRGAALSVKTDIVASLILHASIAEITAQLHCKKKFRPPSTQNFLVTDYIKIFPLAQLNFC